MLPHNRPAKTLNPVRMMAEAASTFKPNTSSDDFIMQETIDSQVGFIPDVRQGNRQLHPVDQTDDTQVSNLSQFDDTHVTNASNSSKTGVNEVVKQEQIGVLKKERRPRKRGKEMKKDVINDFERQSDCDCDKRGDRVRVVYVREELEELRYAGVDEQKKKWIEVYCGLGSTVGKEYDNLLGTKHDEEGNFVSFDPRARFANKKAAAVADCIGNEPDNTGSEMQNTNEMVSSVNGNDLEAEEDYYEDEGSDSDYVSIQRPAFYVTGEPDFDSGPPEDGLEYLRRVRWEAEHIPKVKVAKVNRIALNKEQTVYMPDIPDIAACPEHLMPSKEWEDVFLADFSKLRLILSQDENSSFTFSGQIESLPLAQSIIESTIQENLNFCQTDDGTSAIQENLDLSQTEDMNTISDWPSLQTILEMEPVARVTMLRKRITSMETKSSLCRADCAWLFALCAAIDTPLNADTSASLRCLLRKCATLRAEKTSLDDEVIMLNILVTISGKYFGQLEMK